MVQRVIAISGGTRGIGLALAEAFAKSGDIVAFCGRDPTALQAAVERIRSIQPLVMGSLVDVRDSKNVRTWVDEVVERFGRIDVAIANAGVLKLQPFIDISEDQWDEVVDTHLKGTFLLLQSVARTMLRHKRAGSLITVTAPSALRGGAGVADYASAKGGIISLTKALAKELGPFGIRVNSVLPVAETRMTQSLKEFLKMDTESWNKRYLGGTMPKPEDIVGTFLFLASDAARYVTGQVIAADDGFSV